MFRVIFLFTCIVSLTFAKPIYRSDDASNLSINKRVKGSHINVFIPNMPYLYVAKLINGSLIRSSDNAQGWEYMLATNLEREGDLIYTFTLREGVKFQDGTPFDADSVMENFSFFEKKSFSHKLLQKRLKKIEKLSKYKVQFVFKEPFELFLYELCTLNIYSSKYLKNFEWGFNNAYTANNMKEPGPYGLGPYILKKGYATGREQTSKIELEANPYYFEKGMPYIENITIYTELSTQEVLDMALKNEKLDISPIPFNKKVETITSPYTKLLTMPSRNNISIIMNMIKKGSILKDKKIRRALNEAIDQEKLLKFTYKGEGNISPTTANTNFYAVGKATRGLVTHHERLWATNFTPKKHLKDILNGLELNVVTMEQLMFLWKGIEFQLGQYGVKLNYTITNSEKELFEQLLTNRAQPKKWDLLSWNDDSWSSNNPWTVFFHYRIDHAWTGIDKDDVLLGYAYEYIESRFNTPKFLNITQKIVEHVYDNAYMLAVPSPNIVLAVNKEVDYTPSAVLLMPLWKAKITPYHWSIREGEYPKARQLPIRPKRSKK